MAYWPNYGGRFNVMHYGTIPTELWGKLYKQICHHLISAKAKDFLTQALVRVLCQCSQPTTEHRFLAETVKNNKAIAKVILAEANKTDKGGTPLREVGQTYVKTPLTSCISFPKFRESFGDERLELFTSSGLKVLVTEGSRGMCNLSCNKMPVFFILFI